MVHTVKLNNDIDFPVIGLGTYSAKLGEMEQSVKDAIDAGYRHFDTAFLYITEKEVGSAIKAKIAEGVVKREDIFVTTKLWNTFHRPDTVVETCKKSLSNLGLDYIDLYLIHWPTAFKEGYKGIPKDENDKTSHSDIDYVDTWIAMEECVKQGFTKSIGLSNFNSKQIQRILDIATIKPVVNQVECHPYLNQSKLINFCKERNIIVTGYSPFAGPTSIAYLYEGEAPQPLKDPKIKQLANKYGKTSAQIILRYLIQHGVVPIPKSSNKKRVKENIDIFNFELNPDDMAVMDSLNRNTRLSDTPGLKCNPHYPFSIEY